MSEATPQGDVVVIGGGHAAAQFCASMAEAGQGGRIHLVCEEAELPYQRPPLSKSFLKQAQEEVQPIRGESWYADAGIRLHRACAAVAIDRQAGQVALADGRRLPYGALVLATGTRARRLQGLGPGLENVCELRHAADARRLRGRLSDAQHVGILGGGFIGLEIAATARALGKQVTVLEAAPRLLGRSLSADMAAHVEQTHRQAGIDIRLGANVQGFDIEGARLRALRMGEAALPLDLLVVGIGAVPETSLAEAAGLDCRDGVVVDSFMRSSDPRILAIGDCTRFPLADGDARLESVQNAQDQARAATACLLGVPQAYRPVPWFWSEQGSMRLQMTGFMPARPARHRRPGPHADTFSILHYDEAGSLACVESVNAPMDHMAARKLLGMGRSPAPARACDPSVPLKTLAG